MEIETLIDELSRPEAYPERGGGVEVRQTHMSVVFLVGDRAYKVKKPVEFDFVDYGTLERRKHFCEREVELNRRLAPDVYLGVVPIVEEEEGLRVGGEGEAVEWAVEMVRLPEEAMLGSLLEREKIEAAQVEEVARRVATFHEEARAGEGIAEYARFEMVAGNARDNFEQSRTHVGTTLHSKVFARLERLNDARLEELADEIEQRAEASVARDTHGDLRLDHVYLFPEREPPRDIEIVDCIEFNESFRYADPVADVAFLVMDLEQAGRRDLAEVFASAYFEAVDLEEAPELLDFYTAYRAAVRAKVEGITATESEIPREQASEARQSANAHWMLALGHLESPGRRPALVLVSGLPGVGKSTIARELARQARFRVVDSDIVRKELAGLEPDADASAAFGEGIYTPGWSDRTYGACRVRAEQELSIGGRVLVDATFHDERRRRSFLELGRCWGVPVIVLECTLPREEARRRIESREGGPTDADWSIYREIAEKWEAFGDETRRHRMELSMEGSIDSTVERATEALRSRGLL